MGGNFPGGNFLAGNFPAGNSPGGSLFGGNFPGGSFPDTVVKYMYSLSGCFRSEANLEPKMDLFAKIAHGYNLLTILVKSSISYVTTH